MMMIFEVEVVGVSDNRDVKLNYDSLGRPMGFTENPNGRVLRLTLRILGEEKEVLFKGEEAYRVTEVLAKQINGKLEQQILNKWNREDKLKENRE